jgi:lipoate---protein ligase
VKLLDLTLPTPAENLACDEALLDFCEEESTEVLRFWESTERFVVVGYGNSIGREVNVAECRRQGVPILRRCSGGGTVVQGPGCLNYNLTLRIPENGPLTNVTGTNEFVMERHRAALERLLGTRVSVQGHTDLAFWSDERAAWLKFSGNAQRRRRTALVFHGTILYAFDLSAMATLLQFPSAVPDYRGSRSHLDFVQNIPANADLLRAALAETWNAREVIQPWPSDRTRQLCEAQYNVESWNWRRA